MIGFTGPGAEEAKAAHDPTRTDHLYTRVVWNKSSYLSWKSLLDLHVTRVGTARECAPRPFPLRKTLAKETAATARRMLSLANARAALFAVSCRSKFIPFTEVTMTNPADDHLTETRIDSETLVDGSFLKARRDKVRLPNGHSADREYIVHPGAVVIIPLLDDDHVVLERQFRYPVNRVMLEFPAGKLDAGEDPLLCAQRELQEETGYLAGEWAYAGAMHLAIAYSTEIIHIFFARRLTAGAAQLDKDEFLEVHTKSIEDLAEACRQGGVTDAKTLACMLWLQNARSGNWALDWQDAAR